MFPVPREATSGEEESEHECEKLYRWVHGPSPSVPCPPPLMHSRDGEGHRRGNSSHPATPLHSARYLAAPPGHSAPEDSGDNGDLRHDRETQGRDEAVGAGP